MAIGVVHSTHIQQTLLSASARHLELAAVAGDGLAQLLLNAVGGVQARRERAAQRLAVQRLVAQVAQQRAVHAWAQRLGAAARQLACARAAGP